MDITPMLHKIESLSVMDSRKALVFIPGLGTEEKPIGGKYIDAILKSGWDGEIYYLRWNSSKSESILESFAEGVAAGSSGGPLTAIPAGFVSLSSKFSKIRKAAKNTGRKYLPKTLQDQLPDKRITFVARSLGAYMVYKIFKASDDYPISNPIDDVILLGGALSKKKKKWERTHFRSLINVYNRHDKVLKAWKYGMRTLGIKLPKSPCGRHPVKDKYISSVVNIDMSDIIGNSHSNYHTVFLSGILRYDGKCWNVKNQ